MNKRHKHADLIIAWVNGAEIEYRFDKSTDEWMVIENPHWYEDITYRIKVEEDPYKELKQANDAGKTIQFIYNKYLPADKWKDCSNPDWTLSVDEYRIKPEQKLVPFTWKDREILRGKWIRYKLSKGEVLIYSLTEDVYGDLLINSISAKNTLSLYEFLDSSPIGRYIEE